MFVIGFWFVYFFIICKINTLKILLTTQVSYIYKKKRFFNKYFIFILFQLFKKKCTLINFSYKLSLVFCL